MKIVKLKADSKCELWEFFKDNLPRSLRVAKCGDGYGNIMFVTIKERTMLSYFDWFGNGIARVEDDLVELFHPQYFSDFTDAINKYEAATGKQVTLKYWEG